MIKSIALLFILSVSTSLQTQAQTYHDPNGRFTVSIPANCKTFSPNGDMLQINCGDASFNIMETAGGPAASQLQNVEGQYATQWGNFRKTAGGEGSDGHSAFALYTGVNPRGVPAWLKLVAIEKGWILMETTPQASVASNKLMLERMGSSFRTGSEVAAASEPSSQEIVAPSPPRAVGNRPPKTTPTTPPNKPATAIGAQPAETAPLPASSSQNLIMRFKKVNIMDDAAHIGGVAATMLIPADWRIQSGVEWHVGNFSYASEWVRLMAPDGIAEIGKMPNLNFEWAPQLANMRGGNFYPEVMPPVGSASEALRSLVIPRYFANVAQTRVVLQEELPTPAATYCAALPEPLGGSRQMCEAAKIRFEFQSGGKTLQQDVYCIVYGLFGQAGIVNWSVVEIRY